MQPYRYEKTFKTFFHEDVLNLETVTLSAGKVGYQIETEPGELIEFIGAETAQLIA